MYFLIGVIVAVTALSQENVQEELTDIGRGGMLFMFTVMALIWPIMLYGLIVDKIRGD